MKKEKPLNEKVVKRAMIEKGTIEKGTIDFYLSIKDVAEAVKKLKEEFMWDWEFTKKAKQDPYIHIRRVLQKIDKIMGEFK